MNIRKNIMLQGIFLLTTSLFCFLVPPTWSQEKMMKDSVSTELTTEEMVFQIKAGIDPEYSYNYEKTKFVPPAGKTLLIMGQTVERITEYLDNFPNQKIPGGWSAYWAITEYKGITESHRNETGSSQNHQMLVDRFPNTVIQSAMWMVGKWDIAKNAGQGHYDDVIRKYCAWAKSANRPIYLRIGYEFDGPHNELEPRSYVKAYKRIVDLIREEGVKNIAFVWHSYASRPYHDFPLSDWYPGDDYVDWIGISVFGHAYGGAEFGTYCDDILNFGKQHKKPIMIAESNPVNGIDPENIEVWDRWFVNYFNFIYNKNIKAISFINENWRQTAIEGISKWKDARIYNNQQISNAWFQETNKERYLKQSPKLYEQLGYVKD